MEPQRATLVTTWTTKIVEADRELGQILGVDVAQLVGKPLAVFVDLADRNDFRSRLGSMPENGRYEEWRLRLRHADSSFLPVIVDVTRAADRNGRPNLRWSLRVDGPSSTPSDSDPLETAIRHLAHELNQPLTAIISYARGCVLRSQSNRLNQQDLEMILEQIVAEALRAGAIIREFRRKDS